MGQKENKKQKMFAPGDSSRRLLPATAIQTEPR